MILIWFSVVLFCFALISGCASVAANELRSTPLNVPGGCACDLVANVADRVFFAFNAATLTPEQEAVLRTQAAWLRTYPKVKILVAGNADERGTEAYNLALGRRRASASRNQLVADGVAPARIQMFSYGKECPVAQGHDEAAYQQNRNAITSVLGFNPQKCH